MHATKNISHDLVVYLAAVDASEDLLRRILASPAVRNSNGDPAFELELEHRSTILELLEATSPARRLSAPVSMPAKVAAFRAHEWLALLGVERAGTADWPRA